MVPIQPKLGFSGKTPASHDSFYHLSGDLPRPLACGGLACFAARRHDPALFQRAAVQSPRLYCLGRCFAAPADDQGDPRPSVHVIPSQAVVLEGVARGPTRTLQEHERRGGYEALRKSLKKPREKIIEALETSALRGRGGAGFPVGAKWRVAARGPSGEKYIVANADEGDPGAYIDRILLEDDPHRLLEAMILAGYAVGADQGIIYLRKEYPQAEPILAEAIRQAKLAGFLGPYILGSSFSFEISIFTGRGSYVCGEESSLLNSLEGRRPEPRARPPHSAQAGLWGKPTVVNNVETLAAVPWIVLHGGEAYRRMGFSKSRGTKAVSLNSLFKRPGLYEVEFGIPVREIVETLGGGLDQGKLLGILIGGPLAGLLPPGHLDTPFGFEELQAVGAAVGHGGMVAFDDTTSIAQLVHHVFSFGAFESCGKCTPCRLGTRRIEEIFTEPTEGLKAPPVDREEFTRCVEALREASFCAFGTGLAEFAKSVLRHYPKELEKCFA